jgi:hypothetical protein
MYSISTLASWTPQARAKAVRAMAAILWGWMLSRRMRRAVPCVNTMAYAHWGYEQRNYDRKSQRVYHRIYIL